MTEVPDQQEAHDRRTQDREQKRQASLVQKREEFEEIEEEIHRGAIGAEGFRSAIKIFSTTPS